MTYDRPVPALRGEEQLHFAAAREHRLVFQRCRACGSVPAYPRTVCPTCMSDDLELRDSSGRGTVLSFTTHHRPAHPSFADAVPYTVVLADMEEGQRLLADLVGAPPGDVRVGMAVQVVFDDVTDELTLPRLRPATTEATA